MTTTECGPIAIEGTRYRTIRAEGVAGHRMPSVARRPYRNCVVSLFSRRFKRRVKLFSN